MRREMYTAIVPDIVPCFSFEGNFVRHCPYGNGHINDTFLVETTRRSYILQRINHDIFRNPGQLMQNIAAVTTFLTEKILANGGNPERETLSIIKTRDGNLFYQDQKGCYWRAYLFVTDTFSVEQVEDLGHLYQSAAAFGRFQNLLSDFPANQLRETIPDFHNTPKRIVQLKDAVNKDICGRAASVQQEIQFFLEREAFTHTLIDANKRGELPLRVTHNDTKLNNVLLDQNTGKGICVIDLDTVMPGFSVTDFGDSIRTGAATAAEDEPDLSNVHFDLTMFQTYVRGFLDGCGDALLPQELSLMPAGAKMMTLECGMRFLTDYLEGDHYFRTHRERHNLDRTRTQMKMVYEMEQYWDNMNTVMRDCQR